MAMREQAPGPIWAAIIAGRMPGGTTQRVRANRRLRKTGAIPVRAGVYALPDSSEGRQALAGAARELARLRGSALACLVSWLDPADEERLRTRFVGEHARKRERLHKFIDALERALSSGVRLGPTKRRTAHARLARLRQHLDRVEAMGMPIPASEVRERRPAVPTPVGGTAYDGRTWVTRKGVLVDRIGSAWLIRRFIDRDARFHFVSPGEPTPAGAPRFDMADAEFGHEGDRCTFETLVERFRRDDAALRELAEIVHDLDLRDGRYGRAEAPGIARVIAGLAAQEHDDEARIRQGQWLFDSLYAALRPGPAPRLPKGVLP